MGYQATVCVVKESATGPSRALVPLLKERGLDIEVLLKSGGLQSSILIN